MSGARHWVSDLSPAYVCHAARTRSLGPPAPCLAPPGGEARWHGHSVLRRVEVEYSEGRIAREEVRFVVVHSSQLAQQHAQTYAGAQAKEAEAIADHVRQVQAQWFACRPDAEAAIAAYEGQGPGRRGRRPRPWRYHTLCYGIVAA